MKLTPFEGHIYTFIVATSLGVLAYTGVLNATNIDGTVLYFLNGETAAWVFGVVVFSFYQKMSLCPIPPNHQGIQLFLGRQNGVVWNEHAWHQLPWGLWSIWKIVSIEHFTLTVAAQNRTHEGHQVILLATAQCKPFDAHLIAKMSTTENLRQQLSGLAMSKLGNLIHLNQRQSLLAYPYYSVLTADDQDTVKRKYGVDVELVTTRVEDVNPITRQQFDAIARQTDMVSVMASMKAQFPKATDDECFAMYASIVGVAQAYTMLGKGGQGIILGNNTH